MQLLRVSHLFRWKVLAKLQIGVAALPSGQWTRPRHWARADTDGVIWSRFAAHAACNWGRCATRARQAMKSRPATIIRLKEKRQFRIVAPGHGFRTQKGRISKWISQRWRCQPGQSKKEYKREMRIPVVCLSPPFVAMSCRGDQRVTFFLCVLVCGFATGGRSFLALMEEERSAYFVIKWLCVEFISFENHVNFILWAQIWVANNEPKGQSYFLYSICCYGRGKSPLERNRHQLNNC
jgi:hypothetical protein